MSHPLQALRQVLASQSDSVSGLVVGLENGLAVLATATGRQAVPYMGTLAAGDRVRIENGTAYAIGSATHRYHV